MLTGPGPVVDGPEVPVAGLVVVVPGLSPSKFQFEVPLFMEILGIMKGKFESGREPSMPRPKNGVLNPIPPITVPLGAILNLFHTPLFNPSNPPPSPTS